MNVENPTSSTGSNSGVGHVLTSGHSAKLRLDEADTDKTEKLTNGDSATLEKLEEQIERYNFGWVEAGEALRRIQVEKLHKATHQNFDGYCRERWGFTPQRAHQLMHGAEVAKAISTAVHGDGLPGVENEAQARELGRIEKDDDRVSAWRKAAERAGGKRVTAQLLSEIIAERGLAKQPKANPSVVPARVTRQIENFTSSIHEKVKVNLLRKWTREQRASLRDSLKMARKEIDRVEAGLDKLEEKKETKASSGRAS